MDPARISALLEPFLDHPLASSQLDQTLTYINLLLRWNSRINLTAIRDPEQIVTRHFGESFFLARHLFPVPEHRHPEHSARERAGQMQVEGPCVSPAVTAATSEELPTAHRPPTTVLDIGSGAGFPGLPVKIWAPQIHLALIESNHKKAAFLREATRALTLTDVNVFAERAEILAARLLPTSASASSIALTPPGVAPPLADSISDRAAAGPAFLRADVVTFRAVEKFDQILPLATCFLALHARLAILMSKPQISRLRSLSTGLSILGWKMIYVPKSHEAVLAIGEHA